MKNSTGEIKIKTLNSKLAAAEFKMLHARQKWKLSGDQSSRRRRSKCSALDINENPPRGDQNSSRWCLKQSTLSINEKTPWGKSNSGAHSKNLGTEFKTSGQRNLKCSTPGAENQNSSRRRNSKCSALGINEKSPHWIQAAEFKRLGIQNPSCQIQKSP